MKITILILFLSAILGCTPAGDLTRTLHAPHPKYLDRLNPQNKSGPSSEVAIEDSSQKLNPGLPENCSTLSKKDFCLSCDEDGILVMRCYKQPSSIKTVEACHYDKGVIKCLSKEPAFALFLDYRNSEEKFFRENLETWKTAVHQIWDEKFTDDERSEAGRLISSLNVISEIFSGQNTRTDKDNERFFTAFQLTKDKEAVGLDFLSKIEGERLSGNLKLSLVMKDFSELINKTHGPSPLFEKFMAMSLDGLEEQN